MHLGTLQFKNFLSAYIPNDAKILEVGCGNGCLAKALLNDGYLVEAIDRDPAAAEEARQNGVAAIAADYRMLAQSQQQYDVVMFTRSLHHILPLDETLSIAASQLKADGKLIIDDFGAELLNARSAFWFYSLQQVLNAACELFPPRAGADTLVELNEETALKAWQHHHFVKHAVAEYWAMRVAVDAQFVLMEEQRVPYLFRYFELAAPVDGQREVVRRIYEWEAELCKIGTIVPIGVRLVLARRRGQV